VADAEEPALGVFPQDELIGTAVAYSDGGREVHEQHEAAQESAHRARATDSAHLARSVDEVSVEFTNVAKKLLLPVATATSSYCYQ